MTAVRLLEELSEWRGGLSIPADAIRAGLETAVWPARLELIRAHGLDVLIDGAHNPAGARALAAYVERTYARRLPFVVGVMADKNIEAVLAALAREASHFVFTSPASLRAATPAELVAVAERVAPEVPAEPVETPGDAVDRAAGLGSPVVVAGSLYLAGEIRARLS